MRMKASPFFVFLLCLLSCCAEFDIEVVILDDSKYNETRFIEVMKQFNPLVFENGTEIPLIFSPPVVRSTRFINKVLCVNGTCYKEADMPPPASPSTTPGPIPSDSKTDVIVISVVSSVVILALLIGLCCWLTRRGKRVTVKSRFRRVVIRESIDLSPYIASHIVFVKSGSKHTGGLV